MKIFVTTMQKLSKIKNSVYDDIKIEYLYHSILKKNTSDANYGFAGTYKKIPNKLRSVDVELS